MGAAFYAFWAYQGDFAHTLMEIVTQGGDAGPSALSVVVMLFLVRIRPCLFGWIVLDVVSIEWLDCPLCLSFAC
jgi:hypothetical protein